MWFSIKSKISLLYNNLHFIAIGLLILAWGMKFAPLLIVFGVYSIVLLSKVKFKTLYVVIMVSYIVVYYLPILTKEQIIGDELTGQITVINKRDDTNLLIVNTNGGHYHVFMRNIDYLKPGDYVKINGNKANTTSSTYPNSFDYEEYLSNRNIKGVFYGNAFEVIGQGFSLQRIQFEVEEFFTREFPAPLEEYLKTLFLCRNTLDADVKEDIQRIGISHLFASSGLHVSIIAALIGWFLRKIWDNDWFVYAVVSVFLGMYLVLCYFAISIFRAVLMYFFINLSRRMKRPFTSLDGISFAAIVVLFWYPKCISYPSFQLSFLITFLIIMVPLKQKSKIAGAIKLNFLCFLGSLPVVLQLNYEVNFIALLVTPILSMLFSTLILPFLFLVIVSPALATHINTYFIWFNKMISFVSNIDGFVITTGYISALWLTGYYALGLVLLIGLENKKRIRWKLAIFFTFSVLMINHRFFNPFTEVSFLSCGQGDTSFIELANGSGVIVIDAYGDVTDALKSRGIAKIDYLILTHNHEDHIGKYEELSNELAIGEILGNKSIEAVNNHEITRITEGKTIVFNGITLTIYPPMAIYSNENNNSLVVKVEIEGVELLFTGDIEKEREKALMNEDIQSDIIKVPHHGSNTSSTAEFINAVSPKIAVFSYGLNNKYGHPSKDVLKRFSSIITYHLASDGSVIFRIRNDTYLTRTYPPG